MRRLLGSLNVGPYLRYARLWIVLAVIPALIAGVLGYLDTRQQAKTYDATVTMYVQQSTQAGLGFTGLPDIGSSSQLAQTYSQLATQDVIARAADRLLVRKYPGYRVEDHNVRGAPAALDQQSPLISLTVTDTIPVRAADAANAVGQAFITAIKQLNQSRFVTTAHSLDLQIKRQQASIDRVTAQITAYRGSSTGLDVLRAELSAYQSGYQALLTSTEELRLTRDETSSSVDVYSSASPPVTPTGPHPSRTALLWAFVILLLGSAGIYAYEYINDLPRTPEEVEQAAGSPVLGTIGAVGGRRLRASAITAAKPRSAAAEAYRLIRTNIQFTDVDHPPRTIVVTSALPQEGKSTTISNLARVFAEGGERVTLIDADLRRPSLKSIFLTDSSEGLTDVLLGGHLNGRPAAGSDHANLVVLPAGPLPPNPADLLHSHRMRELVTHVRAQSDIVLIDSPPILPVADAAILSTMVDGVVLVVDPNKSSRRDIRRAREAINTVGGRVLGVVVNRLKSRGSLSYRYSGYAAYDYPSHQETEAPASTIRDMAESK